MSERTTVDEIKRAKVDLERKILLALREFERLGVVVRDVRVTRTTFVIGSQVEFITIVSEI